VPARIARAPIAAPLRTFVPLLLVPLGALYCQVHEVLFEPLRGSALDSLSWAFTTLVSWVAAAIAFELMARPGDTRARLLQRAALLGLPAYLVSACAALALGGGTESAFFSRAPLFAVAMLTAALYRPPASATPGAPAASIDDAPPIAPTEIAFASAAGNYVELHAEGRSAIWRQTMHNAERILAASGFVRVHRSYLVPRRGIAAVKRGRTRPLEVSLLGGRRVPVSNRYAANLRDQGPNPRSGLGFRSGWPSSDRPGRG